MAVHPPAPRDLPGLIDAYAVTTAAVLGLGEGLGPGQESLPTDCPGWTVLDQIRHVASIEAMLLGEELPEIDVSGMPHVRNDFGALIEKYLHRRRDREVRDVLDELREVRERRLADLSDPELTLATESEGPLGRTTVGSLLGLRIFDIWTHEQDLREALNVAGGLDAPGASVAITRILRALPRALESTGGVVPGDAVRIVIDGPVSADETIRVTGEVAGEAVGRSATVSMTTRAFTRRAAGRCEVSDLGAQVEGDADLVTLVLTALAITP